MGKHGLFSVKIKYDGVPIFEDDTNDIDDLFKKIKKKMG